MAFATSPPFTKVLNRCSTIATHRCLRGAVCFSDGAIDMSRAHPIISITGSSGAGTTSVKKTFEQIFRREKVVAAYIEGDAFHRYNRAGINAETAWAALREGRTVGGLHVGASTGTMVRLVTPVACLISGTWRCAPTL